MASVIEEVAYSVLEKRNEGGGGENPNVFRQQLQTARLEAGLKRSYAASGPCLFSQNFMNAYNNTHTDMHTH